MLIHVEDTPHLIVAEVFVVLSPRPFLRLTLAFLRRFNNRLGNANSTDHLHAHSRIPDSFRELA